MKSLYSAAAAALLAVMAVLGFAATASAYPEVSINLTVDKQVIHSGESFTATGTSSVDCAWTLEWNGATRTKTAKKIVTSFTGPKVTKSTKIALHGTCVYDTGSTTAQRAAGTTWERTIVITVLPTDVVSPPVDNGGGLPNTGGPSRLILFGGLGLLLAGATAVTVARRRGDDVPHAGGM